jgi:hypothetical protein
MAINRNTINWLSRKFVASIAPPPPFPTYRRNRRDSHIGSILNDACRILHAASQFVYSDILLLYIKWWNSILLISIWKSKEKARKLIIKTKEIVRVFSIGKATFYQPYFLHTNCSSMHLNWLLSCLHKRGTLLESCRVHFISRFMLRYGTILVK